VQPDARAGTVPCLDRAGDRVAQEQHVVAARELSCLDHGTVRRGDLRAGREVETGLDDTVVTERNSEAGLCAQQAALPNPNPLGTTAGQRPHDRGPPAHSGTAAATAARRVW